MMNNAIREGFIMDIIHKILSPAADIYYGLWANMISWPLVQRAAVVLFVSVIILIIIFQIGKRVLGKLIINLGKGFVKLLFEIWQIFMPIWYKKTDTTEYLQRINQTTKKFSRLDEKVRNFGHRLIRFRKLKIKYFFLFYLICIFTISIPEILKEQVNEEYLRQLAFGQTIYCSLERKRNRKCKKL